MGAERPMSLNVINCLEDPELSAFAELYAFAE
jgi:hypothetical protein